MAISVQRLRGLGCGLLRRVRRRKPYPGVVRRRLGHDGCPSYMNSSESPTYSRRVGLGLGLELELELGLNLTSGRTPGPREASLAPFTLIT
jgi:hypothetical protein